MSATISLYKPSPKYMSDFLIQGCTREGTVCSYGLMAVFGEQMFDPDSRFLTIQITDRRPRRKEWVKLEMRRISSDDGISQIRWRYKNGFLYQTILHTAGLFFYDFILNSGFNLHKPIWARISSQRREM